MQFLVIGRDGTDAGALDRRMEARADHLAACDVLFDEGKLLFGVALIDDNGNMAGSSMVYETESREQLDELLSVEPYVVNKVWESVDIQECRVGPTFTQLFEGR